MFERHDLSFRECRVAARAALGSTRGKTVLNSVRPRGISGVLRGRPPLAVQLYLAARAGRLWWSAVDRFALLEPPSNDRPSNRAARSLRFLNHYWELLVWFVPLAVLMLFAAALALVPTVTTRLAGLFLLGVDMTVAVVMVLLVTLGGLRWLFGVVEPARWKHDNSAIDAYLDEHWSVPLCHIRDDTAVGDGMRALHGWGDSVLIQESGITEPRTLAAIREATTPLGSDSSGVLVVHRSARRRLPVPDARPLGGVTLLVAVTVALPFVMAGMIADWEREACGRQDCTGQPATYGRALYWLFYQYFWTDPPGLAPLSIQARFLGPELRVLILVVVVTVGVTAVRYKRWRKKEIEKMSAAAVAHRTTTLVLVASTVERDAVIETVREANGNPTPTRRFLQHHTIFDLGVVAGSQVLLAQSEQGIESPGAMMLTANDLIAGCSPDYVVLAGTCFGLRKDAQRIGDVLVPTQLRNLNWKKVVQAVDGASTEFVRGDRVSPGVLLDRCRAATVDWPGARVHFGILLSENVVVDSAEYGQQLREREPDALGAEMEGTGVYAAAARSKVDWIIIKGIAGWGRQTTDQFQATAARSAAGFLVHLMRIGALGRSGGDPAAAPSRDPEEGHAVRPVSPTSAAAEVEVKPTEGSRSVFICYAHETPQFKADAGKLADILKTEGLQVHMDQLCAGPRKNWQHWALRHFKDCDFVLLLASRMCRKIGDGPGEDSRHPGLRSELTALQTLYQRHPEWAKYVLPVILPGQSHLGIPIFLGPENEDYYVVRDFSPRGVESILTAIRVTERRSWKFE